MRLIHALLLFVVFSFSQELSAVEASNSASVGKTYGIYLSGIGDTSFDVLSLNAAWNFESKWRATIGFSAGMGLGVGSGIKYLFLEDSELRPYVGLSLSLTRTSLYSMFFNLFNPQPTYSPYLYVFALLPFGIEWTHSSGFHVAVGGTLLSLIADDDPSNSASRSFALGPHVNLGWFF